MVPPTEPLIEHSDAASVSHPRPLVENHRAGGIIVTHARNSAPIHERSDANDDFEMDDSEIDDSEVDDSEMDDSEMDDSEEEEYTLREYIYCSWFPAFKIGSQVKQNFVWPHYQKLEVAPGTRKLRTISRIKLCHIQTAVLQYFGLPINKQLDETNYPDLTLPSIDFVCYDEKDLKMCIQDVSSVTDITNLLTRYVLRTIVNCLHILHDIPDTVRKSIQFRRSSTMCPVKDDIFDEVFLPGSRPDRTSMIVLVIPPWALNNKDFLSFINTGTVFPGSLDEPASASAVMWALLWDMCSKQKCQYFAVTTYEFWAFGNFNHDMETAYVSDLFQAPVYAYDVKIEMEWFLLAALRVPEILLFWMAACVGAGGILWTPCDNETSS